MNLEFKQTDNFPILIQGKPGLNVILNLSCCNHQLETLLIRPIFRRWVHRGTTGSILLLSS